jgi:hypothetical protein
LTHLDFVFFLKTLCLEKCKIWMTCVTESSELQSPLPMKCFPIPGEKLNIVLMCVVPLMVPILRSAKHISNYVRFSVWKCIDVSNTVCGWRYIYIFFILLPSKAGHSV